ncbi:tetratricopeptide repeat-containing sulfotransferase family protein [Capilliphycus salinus ALCB114379]|uniref:tetratricopeptide repeat-containing sulfotransferase family protein n=1 Tax=Capilliphycus salinus TaxID=2768948 RepID=UPI0039A4EB28
MTQNHLIKTANSLRRQGNLDKSIKLYRQALEFNPKCYLLYQLLADVLAEVGDFGEAIVCYYHAIEIQPNSALCHLKLGQALFRKQLYAEAVKSYRRAIQLNSRFHLIHKYLGEALIQLGELSLAAKTFREALNLKPDSAIYYYGLGVALGQRQEAYKSLYQAIQIDPRIAHTYQSALHIDDKSCISDVSYPQAVFIAGCGHSGTSIMLNILGSHPSIYPITEETYLLIKKPDVIQNNLQKWNAECLQKNKSIWVEKTPIHILYIQKAFIYRPNCKFILMIRDGRDVVCSLRVREAYKDISAAIDRWIHDNLFGWTYWSHPQVKVVKYENLVTSPEATIRDICNFLGVSYTDDVFKYYQHPKFWYSSEITKPKNIDTAEDYKNLRNWQINQPLFDGRGRWIKEMTEDDKVIFKDKAQKYLEQFGYTDANSW